MTDNTGEIWKELLIKKDTTLAFRRSGRIVFDSPPDMSYNDGYCWIRCSLKEGSYEILPLVSKIYLNTISAIQIERIEENEEKLGTGNGKPGYVLKLRKKPAILDALFRMVDIRDWISLLKQLKEEGINIEPNPGKWILSKISQENQTLINEWGEDKEPGDILKCAILESLNLLLERADLYNPGYFGKVLTDVPKKIQRQNLDLIPIEERRTLNRFLMKRLFWMKKPENNC